MAVCGGNFRLREKFTISSRFFIRLPFCASGGPPCFAEMVCELCFVFEYLSRMIEVVMKTAVYRTTEFLVIIPSTSFTNSLAALPAFLNHVDHEQSLLIRKRISESTLAPHPTDHTIFPS